MFLLKELRKESGLKRSELARQLKINQNTLANYENELRQAPYELLIQFADYFSVSIDELLGRSGERKSDGNAFLPLNKSERNLVDSIRKLSETNKEKLGDYISLLLLSQK